MIYNRKGLKILYSSNMRVSSESFYSQHDKWTKKWMSKWWALNIWLHVMKSAEKKTFARLPMRWEREKKGLKNNREEKAKRIIECEGEMIFISKEYFSCMCLGARF